MTTPLMQKYDQQNDEAAALILSAPDQNPRFMIDWPRRYTDRRVQESHEVVSQQ